MTPRLAPAVEGADVIIVVTGSHFHAQVARDLAAVLRDGQTILLIQGGTGGSLVVRRELRARPGAGAAVDVAEMDNYPYSLGWPEPTRVKHDHRQALPASRLAAGPRVSKPVLPPGFARPFPRPWRCPAS